MRDIIEIDCEYRGFLLKTGAKLGSGVLKKGSRFAKKNIQSELRNYAQGLQQQAMQQKGQMVGKAQGLQQQAVQQKGQMVGQIAGKAQGLQQQAMQQKGQMVGKAQGPQH